MGPTKIDLRYSYACIPMIVSLWFLMYSTSENSQTKFWKITTDKICISSLQCDPKLHLQMWDYDVNEHKLTLSMRPPPPS